MNKLQVGLDEVGRIHLSRAGYCNGIYTLETTEALRAFFQAERDEALDRWRDPDNPDMVCYPVVGDLDAVWVVYEGDGSRYHATRTDWERIRPHYVSETARRYFATHLDPEPRPWLEAKPGEIWEIGLLELGPSACLVTKGDFVEISGRFEVAIGSSLIESGRRIWPTDAEDVGDE